MRIGVRRAPVAIAVVQQTPRSRAREALARHGGKGFDQAVRADMADDAKLLGEVTPRLLEAWPVRHGQRLRTCIWIGPSARPWMNWSTCALPERSMSATEPCQIRRPSWSMPMRWPILRALAMS